MITMVCDALLLIGALGLLVTLVMGGHTGHRSSPHHAQSQAHHGKNVDSGGKLALLLTFFSPLVVFSVCLGAGAAGLLAQHLKLSTTAVALIALVGGLSFYALLLRPLTSLILNFASKPSKALDGVVAEPAEVISHFDASGRGLVKLTVDGQFVRVLATLEESDRASASEIEPGDRLVVTQIDTRRNACHVARI